MSAPSAWGTNGYGCVGHRENFVTVRCPRNAIVKTYGGKCPECKASQVAANRASFGRAMGNLRMLNPQILPLCPACLGSISGAHGGPDAPYRPAGPGESCGAADCVADDDDDAPDAYDVLNAKSAYRCDGRPWPETEGGAR